jgi:hypothetical protein
MRIALLVALVAAAGAVYLFGGNSIDRDHVAAFYDTQTRAMLERDPGALCDLLSDDFRGVVAVPGGWLTNEILDKQAACDVYRQSFDTLKRIGAVRRGVLPLNYQHETGDVAMSKDRHVATVKTAFRLRVSDEIIVIEGGSVDTLVRKRWRTHMTGTDAKATVELR